METLHEEQVEGKKILCSIVRKSKIINEKEKKQLVTTKPSIEEEKNGDWVVRKSKIIRKKKKED